MFQKSNPERIRNLVCHSSNKSNQIRITNLSNYISLKRQYRVTASLFIFISNVREIEGTRNFSDLSTRDAFQTKKF